MSYDGLTPVSDELAKLYGYSPKNTVSLSALTKEARIALDMGKTKRPTPQQNIAIWRYHVDKLAGSNNPTPPCVNNPTGDNGVNNPTHIEPSSSIPRDTDTGVNNPTSQCSNNPTPTAADFRLINFNIKIGEGRTVISLDAYIVDALMARYALADNTAVRQFIESLMVGSFDSGLPVMKQVRYAIFMRMNTTYMG